MTLSCTALCLQLEVLSILADEQALHLLPPLRLLPAAAGSAAGDYLASPAVAAPDRSFGQACFAPLPAASAGSSRRQELDFYVKLLAAGSLERCLAVATATAEPASVDAAAHEGNGACFARCSLAVPLVLHRLAAACFGEEHAGASTQSQKLHQQALLCRVLQQCSGGSAELQRLQGWLLRWDVAALHPSDAIGAERLHAIEAACRTAGYDADALLHIATEA